MKQTLYEGPLFPKHFICCFWSLVSIYNIFTYEVKCAACVRNTRCGSTEEIPEAFMAPTNKLNKLCLYMHIIYILNFKWFKTDLNWILKIQLHLISLQINNFQSLPLFLFVEGSNPKKILISQQGKRRQITHWSACSLIYGKSLKQADWLEVKLSLPSGKQMEMTLDDLMPDQMTCKTGCFYGFFFLPALWEGCVLPVDDHRMESVGVGSGNKRMLWMIA